MSDYFLKFLMRQRHEQIMEEIRGTRYLQPEQPCMRSRTNHATRRPGGKPAVMNPAPALDGAHGP
mgnify:FL=1